MLVTKKMLLALTLVGAIVGAGIGSLATRSSQSTAAANPSSDMTKPATPDYNNTPAEQIAANDSTRFATTAEQNAYRQGYDTGFSACEGTAAGSNRAVSYAPGSTTRVRRSSNS